MVTIADYPRMNIPGNTRIYNRLDFTGIPFLKINRYIPWVSLVAFLSFRAGCEYAGIAPLGIQKVATISLAMIGIKTAISVGSYIQRHTSWFKEQEVWGEACPPRDFRLTLQFTPLKKKIENLSKTLSVDDLEQEGEIMMTKATEFIEGVRDDLKYWAEQKTFKEEGQPLTHAAILNCKDPPNWLSKGLSLYHLAFSTLFESKPKDLTKQEWQRKFAMKNTKPFQWQAIFNQKTREINQLCYPDQQAAKFG